MRKEYKGVADCDKKVKVWTCDFTEDCQFNGFDVPGLAAVKSDAEARDLPGAIRVDIPITTLERWQAVELLFWQTRQEMVNARCTKGVRCE